MEKPLTAKDLDKAKEDLLSTLASKKELREGLKETEERLKATLASKEELSVVKEDVTLLKVDMKEVKGELKGLRGEFDDFKQTSMNYFDKTMSILTRLDQERIFTVEKIRNLEENVSRNSDEIRQIKSVLKIS